MMRDKIAEILRAYCPHSNEWENEGAALAIIAALPGMVPDLEWVYDKAESAVGTYAIESGMSASPGKRWYKWCVDPDPTDGFYIWQNGIDAISEEEAKAAANAHHRAAIMAAMGVTV